MFIKPNGYETKGFSMTCIQNKYKIQLNIKERNHFYNKNQKQANNIFRHFPKDNV